MIMFDTATIQELQRILAEDYDLEVSEVEAVGIANTMMELADLLLKIHFTNDQNHANAK